MMIDRDYSAQVQLERPRVMIERRGERTRDVAAVDLRRNRQLRTIAAIHKYESKSIERIGKQTLCHPTWRCAPAPRRARSPARRNSTDVDSASPPRPRVRGCAVH